jgi:hypothetical protein
MLKVGAHGDQCLVRTWFKARAPLGGGGGEKALGTLRWRADSEVGPLAVEDGPYVYTPYLGSY